MKEDFYIQQTPTKDREAQSRANSAGDDYPYDRDRTDEASAWDKLAEAMGTPYFFQKAYSNQLGSPIPGTSQGWATMPGRETDQDEKEKELEYYGESEAPPEEPTPSHHDIFDPEELSDTDVELFMIKIDSSLGQQALPAGLLAQKSVWPFLEKMLRNEDFSEN